LAKRDLLSAADLSPEQLESLLDLAARMKGKRPGHLLPGKSLGMLFFDRSLRTRVSFEVAMVQLGGHCLNIFADREIYDLEPKEQVVMDGRAEEHVKDAARTLSRYLDALGVRHVSMRGPWERDRRDLLLRSYAEHASIPVINLESAMEHPCQAIADLLTIRENLATLRGRRLTIAWSYHPDPRSMGVSHSVVTMAAALGLDVTVAHPLGFELDEEVLAAARRLGERNGGRVRIVNDLEAGAAGADVLYARSWGSAKLWGEPDREAMVKRSLQSWCVNRALMAKTANALFMHPLPVRRNVVATDEVLDGERSVIYQQAENRLHAQKALLVELLK
jgi:N-acetylornithine carbamoyltransferase